MYIRVIFTAIAFIINATNYTHAAEVVARSDTVCGYLSNKGIYCFGGYTGSTTLSLNNVYFLDIAKYSGSTAKELATKWAEIKSNGNELNRTITKTHQYGVLGDGSTMIINGGSSDDSIFLGSKTVGFNADTNSWISYPDFIEQPFAARQIFFAASVYVPGYGIGFYGGREDHRDPNWTMNGQNVSVYDSAIEGVRNIGYVNLTFFDIIKSDPWYIPSGQSNVPSIYPIGNQAIFDPKTNTIFFLGGWYYEEGNTIYESFRKATTFNITSSAWNSQDLFGIDAPSGRRSFTLTLISTPTNRDVLLYGGRTSKRWSSDYLFILSLDNSTWTFLTLPDDIGEDLVRADHSAVLVNKTLYIMFGENNKEQMLSSILLLDVTDPYQITFLKENTSTSNSGLSTDATVGIAVGAVIAGILFISVIVFLIRRKKKTREIEESKMENVNWEEIERSYQVTSNPPDKYLASPTFQMSDDSTVNGANNTVNYTNNSVSDNTVMSSPQIKLPGSELLNKPEKPDGGH